MRKRRGKSFARLTPKRGRNKKGKKVLPFATSGSEETFYPLKSKGVGLQLEVNDPKSAFGLGKANHFASHEITLTRPEKGPNSLVDPLDCPLRDREDMT